MKSRYEVGGSLTPDSPNYVVRQADKDFYAALSQGEFCYVLNSRQVGKSSLRVRVMERLLAEGNICRFIDLSQMGTNLTAEQWYGDVAKGLVKGLPLNQNIQFKTWWQEQQGSPVQQLQELIEEILLPQIESPIIVFIDEIDTVLSQNFSLDDFFALIRFFYNCRADNPIYKKLTFALLGVATPSDLMRDRNRTPFNIGIAIDLEGFQPHEVAPLTQGLIGKVDDPDQVMREILDWTGGQPFLTQKLCHLVVKAENFRSVEWIVRNQILGNWGTNDNPQHLGTIRHRLTHNEDLANQLLALYEKVLHRGAIASDDSDIQRYLLLSGIVVKRQGSLTVANRIYEQVFNLKWVKEELAKLRPYANNLNAWVSSKYLDTSRLLRGEALQEALHWAKGKNLSSLDHQFFQVSQEDAIKVEKEEKIILTAAKHKAEQTVREAKQTIRIVIFLLLILLLLAVGILTNLDRQSQITKRQSQIADIERQGIYALQQFEIEPIKGLISAIKSGSDLQNLTSPSAELWDYPASSPLLALQKIGDDFHIKNEIDTHQRGINSVIWIDDKKLSTAGEDGTITLWDAQSGKKIGESLRVSQFSINSARFSKDKQTFITADKEGTITRWRVNNLNTLEKAKKISQFLDPSKSEIRSLRFSHDEQRIATIGEMDGVLKLRNLDGTLQWQEVAHEGGAESLNFHPQDDWLVTGGADGTAKLWSIDGILIQTFEHHTQPKKSGVNSVSFNQEGDKLATAGNDGIVKIWDINGSLISTITAHVGRVETVRFNPKNDQEIATSSSDDPTSVNSSTVRIWDWKNQKLLAELRGHQGSVESIRYSDNGITLATAGKEDAKIRVWNTNKILLSNNRLSVGHGERINSVRFNSKADQYVTAGDDGIVRLWKTDTNQLLAEFINYEGKVRFKSNRFNPKNDAQIAVGDSLGEVHILEYDGHFIEEKIKFTKKHSDEIESLNFSPNGKLIGTASLDKTVRIWNVKDGAIIKLIEFDTPVWSLRFSSNDQFVVGGESSQAFLYNLKEERKIPLLSDQQSPSDQQSIVYAVGFTPDNQQVYTVNDNSDIYKWDLEGKLLDKTLQSYQGSVRNIDTFGKMLATAGSGGSVYLWNFQGQQIADFKGHRGIIRSLDFSWDGKKLVSAGDDGVPRVWEIKNLDQLLSQGCRHLNEYLSNHFQEEKICPNQQLQG
jgi:WD40 repeat protein